ncbi:putative PAS/PAC sensor protein [Lutibaculum baratangense AMV1]|uniref:Putative PAS/PAC sensor protein n=1 Tax=Lutibaculum baratangense AMV1 TaxID=631454 RepID=V4RDJ2_9HYPH|nr:putative PAS/PAC sensor protein [Lutibaculum baratangense AMV1]
MNLDARTPALSRHELQRLGETLANALPDAVVFADREGLIRHWNEGAARIFGYDAGEALGRSLDIIIPERLRQRHWDGYDHMMRTGRSQHDADELLSVPAVAKDGAKLSIQFTVAPVADDEGGIVGVVAVLRDVTETFEEMKRLRRAQRGE